jgi:NitT/TauT family transport system permease protein
MLLATVKTVGNVNSSYMKIAANFGFTRFQTLRKIIIPASFPYLAQGLHGALSASWIFLVAGELMGTYSGLGYLINDARQNLRTDLIMAGIVLIGVMGYCLDKLLLMFETYVAKKWGIE